MEEKILTPYEYLLGFYDIIPMEEFEIKNMFDSPYHFNCSGALINRDGKIRDEMISVLILEPHRFARCRKMHISITKTQDLVERIKDKT